MQILFFLGLIWFKQIQYHIYIYHIGSKGSTIIRSERVLSQYEQTYGKMDSKFALDAIKVAIARDICDQLMKSDAFEWAIEETQMGTHVAAIIIVNNFNK